MRTRTLPFTQLDRNTRTGTDATAAGHCSTQMHSHRCVIVLRADAHACIIVHERARMHACGMHASAPIARMLIK